MGECLGPRGEDNGRLRWSIDFGRHGESTAGKGIVVGFEAMDGDHLIRGQTAQIDVRRGTQQQDATTLWQGNDPARQGEG
ncbi:hypothetical protein JANAI62_13620 [Jannaschia pagri]|uniref:Uncharacterized protein n=1 Tax=Jannaschia pagri TaxID=2829797 RepID=A0ABQ4NKK8_9RHOB|nr:hypothetical protein JANAI61_13660 [Jannaschia sp. AI_61]GIT94739.1 hypothetical protein JANAI62_13620 [Jannaschia sp. AI_62]